MNPDWQTIHGMDQAHWDSLCKSLRETLLNNAEDEALALYSKVGCAPQLAGIALRRDLGLPPTGEGIQELRRIIYALPSDHPAKTVLKNPDFFTISGCRDLLFHVQEHNYTIPDIFELIGASGLRLHSFILPDQIKDMVPTRENLIKLEQTYPGFAGSMFRFVLMN